jgi:hypothetical protein
MSYGGFEYNQPAMGNYGGIDPMGGFSMDMGGGFSENVTDSASKPDKKVR